MIASSRVAELFDELVDLEPVAAEARLRALCGGDQAIFQAVRVLLENDRAAAPDFLLVRPLYVRDTALEDLRSARASTADGVDLAGVTQRPGRYYVLHKLGEGGMGVVYVGYDEQLNRRVALKVLRPGVSSQQHLVKEGRAMARLAHPNVVSVYEVGEDRGRVFLAMELVEGPSLRAWLAERPRGTIEILRVFRAAAHGLAAAHAAGIVHRDFKPENVLLGQDGRARVVDFGIAAVVQVKDPGGASPPAEAVADGRRLASAVAGTPGFMAPEQLRGGGASSASDQWSFCSSLYRAIYGASPFPGGNPVGPHGENIALAPLPVRTSVPAWLSAILHRGLSPEPRDRFPSMTALLTAIEKHLPADPGMDPSVVTLERGILSATLILAATVLGLPMLAGHRLPWNTSPGYLIGVPAAILAIYAALLSLRVQKLVQNRYGRRIAGVFVISASMIVFHRIVSLALGMSADQTLGGDLVLFSAQFFLVALLFEPWVASLGLVHFTGAVVAATHIVTASVAWGVMCALTVVAMSVRLYLDRNLGETGSVPEKVAR